MLKILLLTALGTGAWTLAETQDAKPAPKSIYDFTVKDIGGKEVSLSKYKGEVLLIVNVASL